jgi:hypothetical protein
MFNAPALDVAIGLTFLYLSLALMVTAVNEWIAGVLKLRGKSLSDGVVQLLDGPPEARRRRLLGVIPRGPALPPGPASRAFFAHPLIKALSKAGRPPSYIPPRTFALVVKDLAARKQEREAPPADGQPEPDDHLRRQFRTLALGRSAADTRSQVEILESWFNDAMDRVSGWYKRRLQVITLGVAAALTVLMNADTFRAASILWTNPTIRDAVVEQARARAAQPAPPPTPAGVGDLTKPGTDTTRRSSAEFVGLDAAAETAGEMPALTAADISAIRLFVGWSDGFERFNDSLCAAKQDAVNAACGPAGAADESRCQALIDDLARDRRCRADGANRLGTGAFPGWALVSHPRMTLTLAGTHLAGWLLTAVAVSLGAPFWFDLLSRLVNIRGAGNKPGAKPAT